MTTCVHGEKGRKGGNHMWCILLQQSKEANSTFTPFDGHTKRFGFWPGMWEKSYLLHTTLDKSCSVIITWLGKGPESVLDKIGNMV